MSEVALHKETETKDSVAITCEKCVSGDPALVRCGSCSIFLCDICSQAHKRDKTTYGHKLVPFEELKSLGPSALSKPVLCKVHDGMHLRFYFESCCILIQHRDHKYHFVKGVYTKEKEAVNQLLEETKTKQTLLRDALKGVIEMRARVQEARKTVAHEINATVDGLILAMETVRMKFLQQAREIEHGKLKKLEIQKEELEAALSCVTSNIEFTERALRDGSQVEVLRLKKHVMDRLHELNSEVPELEPCTDDVISYQAKPSNAKEVLNALGRVSDSRIDPTKCQVKTDGEVDALKVWKEINISILVNDQHGRAMLEPTVDVSVMIKSSNGPDRTQKLEVTNKGDGSYHGVYIPHVSGVYRVFVSVSGAEIPGSPFDLNVIESVSPDLTTLQMEAGKVGVVYNTLINQTRDFIVVSRDSKGERIREDDALINVEINEPNYLDPKVVPVQNCGDGRYTFNYKPVCAGNYQVSVKVNGNYIRGSPFTWGVEQWHLVGRNREDRGLKFYQDNMTVEGWGRGVVGSCGFTGGCHSWKVKIVSGGKFCSVGVTDCNVEPAQQENGWQWGNESKRHTRNGKYIGNRIPSNIPAFKRNDVIIVYLNNNMTLTVHCFVSDKTKIVTVENTALYPYFGLWYGDKLTLQV